MVNTQKTNLEIKINLIIESTADFISHNFNFLNLQLLSILLGFFVSAALSTIPAQTGDWGIVAAAIIVTNQEIVSKISYQKGITSAHNNNILLDFLLKYCNSIKIGILYGLFVDAFKLGS